MSFWKLIYLLPTFLLHTGSWQEIDYFIKRSCQNREELYERIISQPGPINSYSSMRSRYRRLFKVLTSRTYFRQSKKQELPVEKNLRNKKKQTKWLQTLLYFLSISIFLVWRERRKGDDRLFLTDSSSMQSLLICVTFLKKSIEK